MIERLRERLKAQLVQTHASWVLICEDVVYKIKKPVNFGFLDYSTLQKRYENCLKEVNLNRRMCPYIYLGVVPISSKDGDYVLEDGSQVVEYAVKMRRIPQGRLLSELLDRVSNKEMELLAEHVYEFHTRAEKRPEFGRLDIMKFNTDENFSQTQEFVGITLDEEDYTFIRERTEYFYNEYESLFGKRIKDGRIVDGHGDIRLEHVAFLDEGVCVFDCIEFNDRFRCGDMINDMCFLSMELEFVGRHDLAKAYEMTYKELSLDPEFDLFLPFFKCYRAYVRGKVYSFMLKDPYIQEKERYKDLARRMFKLSRNYASLIV